VRCEALLGAEAAHRAQAGSREVKQASTRSIRHRVSGLGDPAERFPLGVHALPEASAVIAFTRILMRALYLLSRRP
jgi:hypothetical protein